MAPKIQVVHDVPRIPGKIVFGPGAYTDLAASNETAEKPIVAGIWNLHEVTEATDSWVAEWDEVKYVLDGELVLKDDASGEEFTAKSGDYIWFPTGAKTSIIRSTKVTTLYVEQRHADWSEGPSKMDSWATAKLNELTKWFVEANPKSGSEAEKAASVLPGGNTRTVLHQSPFPLVLESGRGALVTSKDGREYIDFVSEYSAGMFGHSHPKIHEAVHEALSIGISLGSVIGKEGEFGKLIQTRFPSMELLRFTNSGTEANTIALSAALSHTGHKEVLVFGNGYHGSTLSFANGKNPPTNLPHQFLIGTFNDIEATRPLLHYGIGAILVEPLQCAGGVVLATREFLQFLREAANTLNAVLIFDEVVTSRLHYHGMQCYYDVTPDLTTLGKYVGGGFSFGCFGGKREIMLQFDPSVANHLTHSGTFNNNVFTMTAGIAGLKLLTPGEIERINTLGDRIRVGINERTQDGRLVDFKAIGFGSLIGLRFSGDMGDRLRNIFYYEMLKRGIVVGRRGFIILNLMHQDTHVEQLLSAVSGFVNLIKEL